MKSAVQKILNRDSTTYAVFKAIYHFIDAVLARIAFWLTLPFTFFKASRYVRLSPRISFPTRPSKTIRFFDKKSRKILNVHVRGKVDSFTADQVYTESGYDFITVPRFERVTKGIQIKGQDKLLIIDAGANIGLSTRYFAETFPQAKVVGIEPDRANVDLAKINCQGLTNVDFVLAALGRQSGYAKIINPDADPNAYRVAESHDETDLRIVSIRDILASYPEYTPLIYKIDIEGAEADLFAGDTDWVESAPIIILEIHDWMMPESANSRNFFKTISALDRDTLIQGENIVSVRNFRNEI